MPRLQLETPPYPLRRLCVSSFSTLLHKILATRLLTEEELAIIGGYMKGCIPAPIWGLVLLMLRPAKQSNDVTFFGCFRKLPRCEYDSTWYNMPRPNSSPYYYNRLRLAAAFGETDLYYEYCSKTSQLPNSVDFGSYEKISIKWLDYCWQTRSLEDAPPGIHDVVNHVCTMVNVSVLNLNVCNNEMLKVISRSCPRLKHLTITVSHYNNDGLIWFCGYDPKMVKDFDDVRGLIDKSRTVCKDLESLYLDPGEATAGATAIALSVFSKLEQIRIEGVPALIDAFLCIYGRSDERYQYIAQTYNLKLIDEHSMRTSTVMTSTLWSLIVQLCPLVEHFSITLTDGYRSDNNSLSELLPLNHLDSIEFINVNLFACSGFLKKIGLRILHLAVVTVGSTWDTFARSHLLLLVDLCPNLLSLRLRLGTTVIRSDIDVYPDAIIGKAFPKLRMLFLELSGSNKLPMQDLNFFLSCPSLIAVIFDNFRPLSDSECDVIFTNPFFEKVELFFTDGIIRGERNIQKFFAASPNLLQTNVVCANANGNVRTNILMKDYEWKCRDQTTLFRRAGFHHPICSQYWDIEDPYDNLVRTFPMPSWLGNEHTLYEDES